MTSITGEATPAHGPRAVVRSGWFWGCAAVAFVASPVLFATTLVLGALCVLAAAALRRSHPVALAAIGAGLVVGSLPYLVLALLRLAGLR